MGCAALLIATAAAADEMEPPRVALSPINWAEAATSLTDHGIDTPAAEFARINAQTDKRFPGIATSSVPVLLPIDIDAYRKDVADGAADAAVAISNAAQPKTARLNTRAPYLKPSPTKTNGIGLRHTRPPCYSRRPQ